MSFQHDEHQPSVLASAQAGKTPRRRRKPTSAAAEAAQYRLVIDLAPDAIVLTDQQGLIILVNRQTEVLFGFTRAELLGQSIELLIPTRFHGAHVQHRSHYASQPYTRPMGANLELFGRRKDGTEFPVEVSLSPVVGPEHTQGELNRHLMASIRDVSQRKQLERQLHAAEQRAYEEAQGRLALLRAVIEELPTGIYLVKGEDARLVLANRAMAHLWGFPWKAEEPMEAALAAHGTQLLAPNGVRLAGEQLATMRALRHHEAVRQQHELVRRADGSCLPMLVTAVPIDLAVLSFTDRDQPHETDAPIERAEPAALVVHQDVSALAEAERVKDEFIALAAHELRNPMAALRGYADMLRRRAPASAQTVDGVEPPPQGWQVEALEAIDEATRRLVALTDDLLDVTRLQAGRLELAPEHADLVALVRRVARRAQVTTTRHTLRVVSQEDYLVARVDVPRMEQVLRNLLNNAIKYTPDGGEITITQTRDETGRLAVVAVRDPGMGIPAAEQARIFGRFARAANARAHGIGGTGLGLFLSRELVERHGGRIWFESVDGEGTTFFLTLPLADTDDDSEREAQGEPGGEGARGG